jgi:hypothetical protein
MRCNSRTSGLQPIGWGIRGVALAPQTAERSRSGDHRARDRRIAAAVAQIGQRNGEVRENPRGYRKLDCDNDNDNDNGREVRAIPEIA